LHKIKWKDAVNAFRPSKSGNKHRGSLKALTSTKNRSAASRIEHNELTLEWAIDVGAYFFGNAFDVKVLELDCCRCHLDECEEEEVTE